MLENIYDDEVFFEKYSQMDRSVKGLDGAGEWHILKEVLPDFKNKCVLDIGCGYGWHAMYAINQGAKKVVAFDQSSKMINAAITKNSHPDITYHCCSFQEFSARAKSFDIVIASLMLHYLPSYDEFLSQVSRWLKKDGILVFNVEHPVYTAKGDQDFDYDDNGKIRHFPVDNYYLEGERVAVFLGEKMTKYHRTLSTYLKGLLKNNYEILVVEEPTVSDEALAMHPGLKDELRRPMMLIISARKKI